MFKIKVNAKINLSLDITGKQPNGYHLLDMVMSSVNLYDVITFVKRKDKQITVKYSNGISFDNDIALKTAKMLVDKYNFCGADIFIEKHIPEKSGLGGSSADSSGVIFGLCRLNDYPIKNINLQDIMKLGSDVYYMLYGGTRRVQGTGDIISDLIITPNLNFVLLTDNNGVDTATSYKTYKYGYNRFDNDTLIDKLQKGDSNFSDYFCNALYDSSRLLNENIDRKMDILRNAGATKVFMTGSGSGVLGYFDSNDSINSAKEKLQTACKGKYGIFYLNNTNIAIDIFE